MRDAPLICVLGPRGSGKSTLLRHLAREHPRRIVLDPMGEHGELGEALTLAEAAWRVETKPSGSLAVVVAYPSEEDVRDAALLSLALRPGALVIDEAERWIPVRGTVDPALVEHVERGRHYRCALLVATRRPALIWRSVTANASVIYAFRFHEPTDRAYVEAVVGASVLERLDRVPLRTAVRLDCASGDVSYVRVDVRRRSLVEVSAD